MKYFGNITNKMNIKALKAQMIHNMHYKLFATMKIDKRLSELQQIADIYIDILFDSPFEVDLTYRQLFSDTKYRRKMSRGFRVLMLNPIMIKHFWNMFNEEEYLDTWIKKNNDLTNKLTEEQWIDIFNSYMALAHLKIGTFEGSYGACNRYGIFQEVLNRRDLHDFINNHFSTLKSFFLLQFKKGYSIPLLNTIMKMIFDPITNYLKN